jgi:diguanylate cyclase (GGDEF)-like protein
MLDLDHFKAYNDTHGHQAGDRLLKAAAAAWREVLRPGDLLARYGGEEFVAVLADCPPQEARAVAERLRRSTPSGETCSIGVATWDGAEAVDALVRRADEALYAAKRAGRDRVVAVG